MVRFCGSSSLNSPPPDSRAQELRNAPGPVPRRPVSRHLCLFLAWESFPVWRIVRALEAFRVFAGPFCGVNMKS
ncbi:hypothetical protein KC19_7G129000 [Ceratodon purpureus]|uniref:Uncharacterized protein n=1 Tax=Ceratodon purpureus TaxID=3225 RepID=A0A8T0H9J6_CERPU|nr:hypothetical protein KC19_7G129000 [Ceratodon purpureus]